MHDNVKEEAERFLDTGKPPSNETFLKMGKVGLFAAKLGPSKFLKPICQSLGLTLPGGVDPDKFDYFHEFIAHYETQSIACPS